MFKGIIRDRSELTPGERTQQGVTIVSALFILGIIVVSLVLARSIPDEADSSGTTVAITASLLFFAAGAVGAGFGFLFGLPRARFAEQMNPESVKTAPAASAAGAVAAFIANTNLTKVSDWVTTIVVGLSLVNLANIGPAIDDLQDNLEAPLGGSASAGVVGVSVIVVALLAGFILMYLWTSIQVRELLEQSEQFVNNVPQLEGATLEEATRKMAATPMKLVVEPGAPGDAVVVKQSIPAGVRARTGDVMTVELASRQWRPPLPVNGHGT